MYWLTVARVRPALKIVSDIDGPIDQIRLPPKSNFPIVEL